MQVELEISNEIALITFDDGKKNAFTLEGLTAINTALDEAEARAKAIVLAGRPGSFCAGFDLATMTSGDVDAITALGQTGGRLAARLYAQPKPLLAACTGHAFTIGAFCLLACDTRIGEQGAFKFGFNETAMGMVMPAWGFELLKARINPHKFIPTVTQSQIYGPEGAVEAGILDELVEEGKAIETAMAMVEQLSALPADAYAGNKLVIRQQALTVMREDLGQQ
jgi:enoyl-CoA hydratase